MKNDKDLLRGGQPLADTEFMKEMLLKDRIGKEEMVRLFNITYRTLEEWRQIIHAELRKESPTNDADDEQVRFFELSMRKVSFPEICIVIERVVLGIDQIRDITSRTIEPPQHEWPATEDKMIYIPRHAVTSLVEKMVRREVKEMMKYPDLQDENTASKVATKSREVKPSRSALTPKKRSHGPKVGSKSYKGSPLYILGLEHRNRYLVAQDDGEYDKAVSGAFVVRFEDLMSSDDQKKSQMPDMKEKLFQLSKLWARIEKKYPEGQGDLICFDEDENETSVSQENLEELLRMQKKMQEKEILPFIFWYEKYDLAMEE
ncbi:hypothetical protein MRB53_039578 [Persea americana]|nr:hypothetical protein MRB53_039578 [Persea americana]